MYLTRRRLISWSWSETEVTARVLLPLHNPNVNVLFSLIRPLKLMALAWIYELRPPRYPSPGSSTLFGRQMNRRRYVSYFFYCIFRFVLTFSRSLWLFCKKKGTRICHASRWPSKAGGIQRGWLLIRLRCALNRHPIRIWYTSDTHLCPQPLNETAASMTRLVIFFA